MSASSSSSSTSPPLAIDRKLPSRQRPGPLAFSIGIVSRHSLKRSASTSDLSRYGVLEDKIIGKGANAIVKISHKYHHQDPPRLTTAPAINRSASTFATSPSIQETLYAVKEFAKPKSRESEKDYMKKVAAEFTIGTSLHHPNVVETVDLITTKDKVYEVMEFCPGGDLCSMIQHQSINPETADRYFAELIHGLGYIHGMGVAHRDLKPENLMLDAKGHLKITDFGEAEVFQNPFGTSGPQMSKRHVGSAPYMAPEEHTHTEVDPRAVDIWACGIIYLAMRHSRIPWAHPTMDDPCYRYYTRHRDDHRFPPIESLPRGPRELMRVLLEPDPCKRATMTDIRGNEWFQSIEVHAMEGAECGAVAHPEHSLQPRRETGASPSALKPVVGGNAGSTSNKENCLPPTRRHGME
ncbi:hypothetical protein SeMB42_g06577 [Synchytrium endobioticum]|uniref:Protein kinase domain-containing protein n=1 Tax=Synchytrium endobioticum TaxID=286115 RepID=A0A507CGW2_9FUNG|nr:hypothetical protein SeMB42_g06574 [Synchytrium endobioticum]TPX38755.1 hypothetical protein SeMB42_g06577 [Synchytrium endobioticum]TPX38840.1 hypothetical protein SeLEV6574_g07585 [Synchytrium endobioticum]